MRGTSLPEGERLVNSWGPPERRKSKREIDAMPIEDQIIYRRLHPMTEAERQAELEREDRDAYYQTTGEVDAQDLLDNEPPSSWGR